MYKLKRKHKGQVGSMNNTGKGMWGTEGLTLVEILIAISIFAVGLLAVATMQVAAIRGNAFGNKVTQATCLAQAKLEELKSAHINSLVAGNYSDPNNLIDETGANGGIFNRSWVIANNTPMSRVVTITVTWTKGGGSHNVVLNSITRGDGE